MDRCSEEDSCSDEDLFDRVQRVHASHECMANEAVKFMRKRTVAKKFVNRPPTQIQKETTHVNTQCNLLHAAASYNKGIQAGSSGQGKAKFVQTYMEEKCNQYVQTETGNDMSSDEGDALALLQNDEFMQQLISVLKHRNQIPDFVNLLQCLQNGKLSADNIAWLCSLERAKYAACKTTTQMKYRPETTEFWNIIYLLFGNSALTVFRGSANFSQVATQQCKRGSYDPQKGVCNFSVPSIPTLRKVSNGFERKIPPGFIQVSLNMGEKRCKEGGQFTLSFDSKKIAEGCTGVAEGDVDLMGFEKPRLRDRLKVYEQQMEFAEYLSATDTIAEPPVHALKLLRCITKLSKLISHLQRSIVAKAIAYNKMRAENAGNIRSEKRFQYTASFINVKRHECEINMNRGLELNKKLMSLVAKCKGIQSSFASSGFCDLSQHPLAFCLLPPETICQFVDFSNYTTEVKQRSKLWFDLRRRARITGSTMYDALGLDTFNLQKEHFHTYMRGWPDVHDQEVRERMQYGSKNEIHAVCTIVSRLMPCYFGPCARFLEQGMHFFGPEKCPNMMEVSADGLISCTMGQATCPYANTHFAECDNIAVEIKCCFPTQGVPHMPYDQIPQRYVTQCLAEMYALKCTSLLLVCWTPTSTSAFLVHFDEELWRRMYALACNLYGDKVCKLPEKANPESKEIAMLLGKFIQEKTKLVAVIPSLTGTEGPLVPGEIQSPYRPCPDLVLETPHSMELLDETKCCAQEAIQVFTDSHNCLRNPAQEVMVWMLNDKDRLQKKDTPNSVPVCYHMKGRKFDMEIARNLVHTVRDELHKRNIDILAEVYDGQFHPIIVKDREGKPLTRMQLYKQTWNTACSMNKEHLINTMLQTSSLGIADLDILRVLRSLPHGPQNFSNLYLDKGGTNTGIVIGTLGGDNFPEAVAGQFKFAPLTEADRNKWNDKVPKKKRSSTILGLQEDEFNLLEAMHPELLDDFREIMDEEAEQGHIEEDELPDLISSATPLERVLTSEDFTLLHDILRALRDFDYDKWKKRTVHFLYPNMLRNTANLNYYCTKPELGVIAKVLQRYTTHRKWFDNNEWKYFNVNLIASGFGCHVMMDRPERRVKKKFNPPSLVNICKAELNKPSYPLVSLRVSYAVVLHKYKKKKWLQEATVPMSLPVPYRDTEIQLFAYPEYSATRKQAEWRTFDPVHVLTKVRGHLCRTGYKYAKKEAFQELSKRRPDILSRSAVFDVIDPQNAFIAERFFSRQVEQELRAMGYEETSDFVQLFRFFFQSLNERGMSADERCAWMFDMQKFLLQGISLDTFPPQFNMNYVNGMPIKTFEAILQMISCRFSLYNLAKGKTYNMRSVTTLPCESFFSDLTRSDREGHMYPKAANISRIIGKCITLNYAKHNPRKAYEICTSNKSAYPVHLALDDLERYESETPEDFDGVYRDHFFDYVNERNSSRCRREDVTKGLNPMRTVQGVRQWFRTDESKLNPAHRVDFPIPDS